MLLKWLHDIKVQYKAWKLGREEVETKTLASGSIIIRTEKSHIYFYAHLGEGLPVMMSKEEGERLWNLSQEPNDK
jgi:hypothetical protein